MADSPRQAKAQKKPKREPLHFVHSGNAVGFTAMTRSEARAIIKMKYGLKRLPVGFNLQRVK